MYQVIIIKNNQLSVHWFNSQTQAYDFVSTSLVTKYKIYNPNETKRLDFLSAFYWDDGKKDFCADIPLAKEILKIHYRDIRSILFPKLDTAFLKSIEEGDETKKQYIVNLKTQLRDITDFNLPDNEQELYDYIPPIFKEVYDLVV
jgi:hypothetical protein